MPRQNWKKAQEPAEESGPPAPKSSGLARELLEWLRALVIALVLAVFITQVVIVNARVPSGSMQNTIRVGDRVIGLRFAYWFSEPERGDIMIFRLPDDESQLFIKRLIGLPGETLEIRDGRVYINGAETPLDEPYLAETPAGDFGPYTIPEDSYFMMGDNRGNSWDSRYWENTFVPRDNILGEAVWRMFPNPTILARDDLYQ